MLINRFNKCSVNVKLVLFKEFLYEYEYVWFGIVETLFCHCI